MPKKLNLLNRRNGKLLVIEELPQIRWKNGQSQRQWKCICDCGKESTVSTNALTRTKDPTSSCGCQIPINNKERSGPKSPTWKRGWITDDWGYKLIRIPLHHRAKSNGYVREHIVVMEKKLGRRLLPKETIHHINGVKDDNRPENLELWLSSHPPGQRVEDLIVWAKEILKIYG